MRNPEHCPKCGCEGRFGADMKTFYEVTPDANYKLHRCKRTDERSVVLDLVRHSGLGAIAEECHRLAVERGKYPEDWDVWQGAKQVSDELMEWLSAALMSMDNLSDQEFGDTLAALLSVGHHMGYDAEHELAAAMQRNRDRAKEGV